MIENLKTQLSEILKEKKISLIIFGETHGFLDDNKIQEEIIKIFKPDIFLYEMLEETELISETQKNKFLEEKNNKDFSVISNFGELKKTIALAKKYHLPILGNDIKNMCRENRDFLKKNNLTEEEIREEKTILENREIRQSQKIITLSNENKKILSTTGAFHLRKDSPLLNLNIGKSYLIIYPVYNGEQLFEPPEDFDIKKISIKIEKIS
jgi:hypothetical protein